MSDYSEMVEAKFKALEAERDDLRAQLAAAGELLVQFRDKVESLVLERNAAQALATSRGSELERLRGCER